MRRIGRDDLAGDEPVEQHTDGREVLLDGRLLEVLAEATSDVELLVFDDDVSVDDRSNCRGGKYHELFGTQVRLATPHFWNLCVTKNLPQCEQLQPYWTSSRVSRRPYVCVTSRLAFSQRCSFVSPIQPSHCAIAGMSTPPDWGQAGTIGSARHCAPGDCSWQLRAD